MLYEPTLFALVDAQQPPPNGADGIRNAVAAAGRALDTGDRDRAAEHFIDFWMGVEVGRQHHPSEDQPSLNRLSTSGDGRMRCYTNRRSSRPLPRLDIPILYMLGEKSPESARAVARVLVPVLPRVRTVEFQGPRTHGAHHAPGAGER
jgi:hypothetical protein